MIVREFKLGEKINEELIVDNHLIFINGKLLHISNDRTEFIETPALINEIFYTKKDCFLALENSQIVFLPKSYSEVTKNNNNNNRSTTESRDELKIYQSNRNDFFKLVINSDNKKNLISLKTTDKREALIRAKNFIKSTEKQHNFFFDINDIHSFTKVLNITIKNEKSKVLRNLITPHTFKMFESRVNKHIFPFFQSYNINEIQYQQVNEFFNHLCNQKYSSITLSQYLVALKKIFETAKAHRWINDIPPIPKVRVQKKARGWFTLNEYKKLYKYSVVLSETHTTGTPPTHRNKRGGIFTEGQNLPIEFRWLIRFMVNGFIRPVDLKIIQHQHVEIIEGKYTYLRLNLPESKRHIGQVITLPAAVFAYKQLVNYFKQFNLANPNDYLFLPEIVDRQAAISILEKSFRKLLIVTNLRYSSNGSKRTLYSLRHSAISYRLLYGKKTDLLTLARNARTSIEMIDKYYASEISAEMKIEHIHS